MQTEKYLRLVRYIRKHRKAKNDLITAVRDNSGGWVEFPQGGQMKAREEELIDTLDARFHDAQRVYVENTEAGSPAGSVAYDAGRSAGLREALEIVTKYLI